MIEISEDLPFLKDPHIMQELQRYEREMEDFMEKQRGLKNYISQKEMLTFFTFILEKAGSKNMFERNLIHIAQEKAIQFGILDCPPTRDKDEINEHAEIRHIYAKDPGKIMDTARDILHAITIRDNFYPIFQAYENMSNRSDKWP